VALNALRQQFTDWPVSGLDEIFVVKDGSIIPFYP
jgi:hypothetical protein